MTTVTAALAAERIKLFSTRAPLLAVAAAAVAGVGVAALQAANRGRAMMAPEEAALGVAMLGVPVLMVVASMTVTAEFRTQTIRTTFLAVPNRVLVLTAKAALCAAAAAAAAALMVLASLLVASWLAPPVAASELSILSAGSWRTMAAFALYAAVAAVLGVGAGALIRAAPGTVAVLLLWPMVAETVLGLLPGTGAQVGPYLPFANAYTFIGVDLLYRGYDMRWGPLGGLVYFIAVAAAVFVAALVAITRRDA